MILRCQYSINKEITWKWQHRKVSVDRYEAGATEVYTGLPDSAKDEEAPSTLPWRIIRHATSEYGRVRIVSECGVWSTWPKGHGKEVCYIQRTVCMARQGIHMVGERLDLNTRQGQCHKCFFLPSKLFELYPKNNGETPMYWSRGVTH